MRLAKRIGLAALVVGLVAVQAGRAEAGFVFNISQVGNNVVATGSGTINTTGLQIFSSGTNFISDFQASTRTIVLGPPPGSGVNVNLYSGFTGPASFGTGGVFFPNSASGDIVGIYGFLSSPYIVLPSNYVSGSILSDTATFTNQSFITMGLVTGSYQYTFGSGVNADSLTVNIGNSSSVPEPSSLVLMGIAGITGLGYAGRRRRSRVAP